jgi:signal peptidase II
LKKHIKEYLFLIPVSGTIVLLDQITKNLVRSNLAQGASWSPWLWLAPYVRIVHWYNTGVAFGLLQGQNLIFTVVAVIIALSIFFFYPRFTNEDWLLRLALALQLGGAIGNLIDRITIGHVVDFISVGNLPVFNIADAGITCGVLVMIFGIWWKDRQEAKTRLVDVPAPKKPSIQSSPEIKK